jgi:hypothetical protein
MSLEVFFVAEMLQRLEQQGAAIRPQAVMIATALSNDRYPVALEASAELHRALDAFVSTTARLQDHVVECDGMGKLGESIGELVLRARALVIKDQLDVLSVALRDPAVQVRVAGWFGEQLASIEQLRTHLHERMAKLHAGWLLYRPDQPGTPGMTEAERATAYRMMVRVAQRALGDLRNEPNVARFLAKGMEAHDIPEVNLACRQIDLVLGLEFDLEAGRLLPRKRGRIGTPPGVPEQR